MSSLQAGSSAAIGPIKMVNQWKQTDKRSIIEAILMRRGRLWTSLGSISFRKTGTAVSEEHSTPAMDVMKRSRQDK
ncbi:hypothetical protein ACFPFV_02445 [Salinicoccus siamensis]|uniref:hypothetical protein n=1 Tax=Salinicoccus siamensis TaxID=381830 RepID=UPI00361C366F